MVSYWERQAEERRRRSLEAQSARYSRQVPQLPTVSSSASARPVQAPAGQSRAQAEARVAQSQRERAARELEAAQREQAEARANLARSQREAAARAAAEAQFPTQNLFEEPVRQFESPLEFYADRVNQQERQAEMAPVWEAIGFGPERGSVVGGEAGKTERAVRDWVLSEQEFREGAERLGEGQILSGVGFLGLGALGLGFNVGDLRRLGLRGVRALPLLPDAARAAETAGDVSRALPPGRPPEPPSLESIARRREQDAARGAEERARQQIWESQEFNRLETQRLQQERMRWQDELRLRDTPAGPPRTGPEGVRALRPVESVSRSSNPTRRAADALLSDGTIRPVFRTDPGEFVRKAKQAFSESGISDEVIEQAATDVYRNSNFLLYSGSNAYGRRAASQANEGVYIELLDDLGTRIGATPARGFRFDDDLTTMATRFEELEPAVSTRIDGLGGILDSGRLRSGVEMGGSSNLGFMPWWQRASDIEGPTFGLQEGYASSPIYGFLTGRRGTSPQNWELRNNPTVGGNYITSPATGSAYGEITLRFNDNVRNNTSFVFGDSILEAQGIGRPLSNVNPEDVILSGGNRAGSSAYIEAQIWQPPRVEDIASITAPQRLHGRIRQMLDERGLDIPIYDEVN